ncbi:MAG: hypothetical protein WC848_06320 [Parcubacteria group bacterium]|jgi:hypothetical protein
MDKKKLALVASLILLVGALALVLLVKTKNQNEQAALSGEKRQLSNPVTALPIENLTKLEKSSSASGQAIAGKVKLIQEDTLAVEDRDGTLNGFGISGSTPVFFVEEGKADELKQMADLRIGDSVEISYDEATMEVGAINVLVGKGDNNK